MTKFKRLNKRSRDYICKNMDIKGYSVEDILETIIREYPHLATKRIKQLITGDE